MYKQFKEIFNKYNIIKCEQLTKGFSKDEKYIVESNSGKKYILRVSDISLIDKRKNQFEILKQLNDKNIYCSKPIEFGILNDNNCYTLLSWLDGIDARTAVKDLSDEDVYLLGVEAGKILKEIHNLEIDEPSISWWDKYLSKMERKIKALLESSMQIPLQEQLIKYYRDNVYLMKNRPMCFCHGDYHLGNMIVCNGKIGIIDFDKCGIADPYDEFKPFCWNTMESEYFETGLIDGYFDYNIPDDFFKILKYYTVESMISHLPWAVNYGKEEVVIMQKINELQMKWWDNFNLDIPTWYKKIK